MHILLIDDNPYDRELIIRSLKYRFPEATYTEIIDQASFEEALRSLDYTIIFTDYQLKWSTGLEILKVIRQHSQEIPVIMVTDTGSEEIATMAMKSGLNDYIIKTHLGRLPIAVQDCLEKAQMRVEHQYLESQLQKAQRMESLGLLVSGIVHDFNNTLAAIIGYAQRGMQDLLPEHPLYDNFQRIRDRAEYGAHITHQLLSFARGTPLDPTQVHLDEMLISLRDFLQKLLGPTIELKVQYELDLLGIYADKTQIEQVLVNLCLNARDAMPAGGVLSIAVQNMQVESGSHVVQSDMLPGPYVLLTLADTGIGMDEQVQARLFEPFFTTKDVGQGTGLGLAVVYGIMKQHHGLIQIQSAPGKGATFCLYFPAISVAVPGMPEVLLPKSEVAGGSETLLLVEDDPDIQLLISEFLRDYGYTLVIASNGEEGLSLFEQHASSIALVIADIMMPRMKGKEFQQHIRQSHPTVKVLVMSGYQEMDLKRRELLDPGSAFLQKPFDLEKLAVKVRELLTH